MQTGRAPLICEVQHRAAASQDLPAGNCKLCGGNCVAGQQISNGATNDGLKRVNMNSNRLNQNFT